jgi:putative DNA primase/helicase
VRDRIVKFSEFQRGDAIPPSAEDSLALEFASRHAGHVRYVAASGRWLTFDGICWRFDDTLHAFDRARDICREAARDCDKTGTASAVASAKTVAAVERLARADRRLVATVDQWNADPWLFTDAEQTHDLRTGDTRAPAPLDFITKRAAVAAAPRGTPYPLWSAFLKRVTNGKAELERFLQRYAGYCLTGVTSEHKFVFAYGGGANGKSTFLNTLGRTFGDYATIADMASFIVSSGERHPTDLAKLHGARLVIAQETQKGRRWDETKIKALTGGDRITARFMRQDFFDFTPTFKLFIGGNHKPRLSNVNEAMRRRLLLAPFTVQIPASERDPQLQDKLVEQEGPAILRWCLDGCFAWQQMTLAPPAIVTDATDGYFADEDTLGQWLDECTQDGGPFALTRTAELFGSWKRWCEDRNHRPGSSKALTEALVDDRGFEKARDTKGQRCFLRLILKPPDRY